MTRSDPPKRPCTSSHPRPHRRGDKAISGAEPRIVAAELVGAVLSDRRALDEAMAANRRFQRLPDRDRAFARLIVATVLRRRAGLDRAISGALAKPLAPKAAPVMDVLRCGLAQVRYLDTPAYAAIGTSVAAIAALRLGGFKGLVNAVLRRLSTSTASEPPRPAVEAPDWLFDRWARTFGTDTAHAITQAHLIEPPLDLTVSKETTAADWATQLGGTLLPTGATVRRSIGGSITALPGFGEGAWWVQDVGATLPARLLGTINDEAVLDLCAAPGGKTAQLAAAGAQVLAVDRSEDRLGVLRQNLRRLSLQAETQVADLTQWEPDRRYGHILLDAPCTATGTIRRHPDLQWLKQPKDVDALAGLQTTLLDRASRWLSPGGVLVWCTCSLEPEEGPDQIDRLLARRSDMHREPIRAEEIGGWSELLTGVGEVRSRPDQLAEFGGIDGFHISRLRKVA